jgi:hypothetical protein
LPRYPFQELLGAQFPLRMLRQGKVYNMFHHFANVPATETRSIELRVPEITRITFTHRVAISSHTPIRIELLEEPDFTPGVTEVPSYNADRNSPLTAGLKLVPNPTGITGGILIEDFRVFQAGAPGISAPGAITDFSDDVLKPNASYIVRVTNNSGSTATISLYAGWYELFTAEFQMS